MISLVIHKMGITSSSYLGTLYHGRVHENRNISWYTYACKETLNFQVQYGLLILVLI
jgi:hypothetical protein